MNEPDNIKSFNFLTAFILAKLYESFPEGSTFESTRLLLEAGFEHGPDSDEQRHFRLFSETLTWLEAEGFISIGGTVMGPKFHDVRLTLRGLTAIGYAPPSLEGGGPSVIDTMRAAAKDGFRSASADIVASAVKAAFKAMAELAIRTAG